VTYAAERGVLELYKTFVRSESQAKYFIPMQFAIRGRPVSNRWLRWLAGVGYAAAIGTVLLAVSRIELPGGVLAGALLGGVGGWMSAAGGAWKDAPFEGFHRLKFFRSPALATGFAAILMLITRSPLVIATAALGFTIAATAKGDASMTSPDVGARRRSDRQDRRRGRLGDGQW
jgi:hypothetical protein